MHAPDVFRRIVLSGAAPLLARGFAVTTETAVSLILASPEPTAPRIRVAQDRGFEIDVHVAEHEGDAWYRLAEVAAHLGSAGLADMPAHARGEDAARDAVALALAFLEREAQPILAGDAVAFRELAAWAAVDRGLYTQPYTAERRPADRWRAIERAWRAHDHPRLLRLIDALPAPLTAFEERARAYAAARLA